MMHAKNRKGRVAALLVLILIIPCLCAPAESKPSTPAAESQTVAKLLEVIDFKFFERKDGIGSGSAPVYTAPSEDSVRLNDGKAKCRVDTDIYVAGREDNWLMVRYEIKDKKVRVGYIPPKYSKGYRSNVGQLAFDRIPVQLAEDAEITDNPRANSTPFGTLSAGADITILGKYTYTGNWWYIEAKLDGKLTRGFINRSTAAILADGAVYHGNAELGYPAASPEGAGQTGMITINGAEDDAMIVRKNAGTDSSMVARVYGGEHFPCYGTGADSKGKTWYRIWVDGVWGWFASGAAKFTAAD